MKEKIITAEYAENLLFKNNTHPQVIQLAVYETTTHTHTMPNRWM